MPFLSPRTTASKHGHPHTIQLKLRDMSQLFNSMDPSPFIEKDLDDDAEEFVVSWAQEFPSDAPVRLRIYLEQWPAEDPKELIKMAVHNHFAHRASITDLEFKRLLRQGRTSLFIGLLFLSVCLLLSKMLLAHEGGTWAAVVRESLTIAGWVAMWRPMQIYLYDWWPLRQRCPPEKRQESLILGVPFSVVAESRLRVSPRHSPFYCRFQRRSDELSSFYLVFVWWSRRLIGHSGVAVM
jgi:hypothetical protein